MDVVRIRQPQTLTPLNVVMIVVVIATLVGGYLLLSASESKVPVDGANEWHAESPLRAVVEILCLNYQYPTLHQGDVKVYLLGIGTGLACVCIGIAILVGDRRRDDVPPPEPQPARLPLREKKHIAPLFAAQAMFGMYVLWSFASSRWSTAPDLAIGGSMLLAIHLLWALGLGHGLSRKAAGIAGYVLLAVATATAAIAIWYYYGRNPTLRAKFPFGNPIFLAATLIPGLTIGLTLSVQTGARSIRTRAGEDVIKWAVLLAASTLMAWAFALSDSRGPMAGLAFALLGTMFFSLKGRWKLVPALLAVAVLVLGSFYVVRAARTPSADGRDSTLRFRLYANAYAWNLFSEKPLIGHGQGGFVLHGDAYAANDVLADPEPLKTRLAHAHNEWLEVMSDLGTTGLVLVFAALFLTLRTGRDALRGVEHFGALSLLPPLMGSLIGLTVDGLASVGLRVSGVGLAFYSVIGLIWALSGDQHSSLVARFSKRRPSRTLAGLVAVALGLSCLVASQTDFRAAMACHKAITLAETGKVDELVSDAQAAQFRLSPQRAIANRYRLALAHIQASEYYQFRGEDRLGRAREQEANPQLPWLAEQDYKQSREHCAKAGEVLAALVQRAPSFFNHGYLVYLLNLTLARDPASADMQDQYLEAARTALEREMARQPYSSDITVEWARLTARSDNVARVAVALARPLRFGRLTPHHVELLGQLTADPDFLDGFNTLIGLLRTTPTDQAPDELKELMTWSPEVLRLFATVVFMDGDYGAAVDLLEEAVAAYERIVEATSLGAASAFAELAVSRFYESPDKAAAAIEAAGRARELCPNSLPGRRLRLSVLRQEIDYQLAAHNEDQALVLLRKSSETDYSEDVTSREIAFRYLGLCESMLRRRQGSASRQPPRDLTPLMIQWIQRAIALEPRHGPSHYVAADLELHRGNDMAACAYLDEAFRLGVDPNLLRQFVVVALQQMPRSASLQRLYKELTTHLTSQQTELSAVPPAGE